MRAGRAKPWPPTCRRGIGRGRRCGEEAHVTRCCSRRGGANLLGDLEETGIASVWKRWGESSEQYGQRTVRMRARETELARVARESERMGRSSCGCPDGRRCADARALAAVFKKKREIENVRPHKRIQLISIHEQKSTYVTDIPKKSDTDLNWRGAGPIRQDTKHGLSMPTNITHLLWFCDKHWTVLATQSRKKKQVSSKSNLTLFR
jgi:hypothetical protein